MCGVPGERLSPHSLPTPHRPTGHLAFLLWVFLINTLSQRQKLWWEAAYFVQFWWCWCEHSTHCWEVPVQTSTLTYLAVKTPQVPMGCQKRLQILQKLPVTPQGSLAHEGPPAPHKSPSSPQASFKTPLVCGKILQEPKALSLSHPFHVGIWGSRRIKGLKCFIGF